MNENEYVGVSKGEEESECMKLRSESKSECM